jgi:uncharacterized membrane protein
MLSFLSKKFLVSISIFYKDFLTQAARYFCEKNNTMPFSTVVKIKLDNFEIYGLITYETKEKKVIFIPTSPVPTSGFIVVVPSEKVIKTNIRPEDLIKFTLTSGAFDLISKL